LSDKSEKPGDLIAVTDLLEIIKFFDKGSKSNAGVTVWTTTNEGTAHGKMIGLSQSKKMIYTTALTTHEPKKFYADLKAASNSCFFNVKMETATLFFTTELQSSSPAYSEFTLPEKLFKVQRRQSLRFRIIQNYLLRVSFRDPDDLTIKHHEKIYDIGSGGLSFLINNVDPPPFKLGQILTDLKFTLRNCELNLAGEIVQYKRFTETVHGEDLQKIKVSIKFLQLNDKNSTIIEDYVFEENRKFYARFI